MQCDNTLNTEADTRVQRPSLMPDIKKTNGNNNFSHLPFWDFEIKTFNNKNHKMFIKTE